MRDVLPDDNTGSRIIVTTRNNAVAAAYIEASSGYVHRIEPLSEAMSLDLFCRTTFGHDPNKCCPPELEHLSLQIVRMCEGLPFAIEFIAGLLSKKKHVSQEWRKLLENFNLDFELYGPLAGLLKILALSFLDLPPHLKPCFLYYSIFPKESLIPNDKLFKLWIAEGFVQEKAGKTLEEVAEEYLNELISKNLIEMCEGFYGIEKFSRVNTLMHEVARKKASERSFCQIWDDKDFSFRGNSRRLSITRATIEQVLDTQEESRVRSVFISNNLAPNNSALLALFEKYKLLTLLEIENIPLMLLPEEVGNLLCLKYLSLKSTKVKKLPKSVGKLHKLQTLDLSSTLLVELPMEIFKLRNLRHLLASRCDNKISIGSANGVQIKAGIGNLVNLQTLLTVEAHLSGMDVVQELKRLRRLRSLSVSRMNGELARALCVCIQKMSDLKSLRLHSMNNQILDLQAISSPPPHLERLVLKGLLNSFPNWISSLQNINMLCLSLSGLVDDPLQHLYRLQNLESLWLYRAYEGEKLHFREGGFKKLKLLVLRDLQNLEAVEIEEGALSLLEELRIGPSPLLNAVPSGIKNLRNLKIVSFYDMPNEFGLRLKPDGGLEYWKVERVPSVLFYYKDEGRRYISYRLGEMGLLQRLEGLDANINDVNQRDIKLSFCYSDEEEDSAPTSTAQWNDIPRMNLSSDRFSFFTDDVDE